MKATHLFYSALIFVAALAGCGQLNNDNTADNIGRPNPSGTMEAPVIMANLNGKETPIDVQCIRNNVSAIQANPSAVSNCAVQTASLSSTERGRFFYWDGNNQNYWGLYLPSFGWGYNVCSWVFGYSCNDSWAYNWGYKYFGWDQNYYGGNYYNQNCWQCRYYQSSTSSSCQSACYYSWY